MYPSSATLKNLLLLSLLCVTLISCGGGGGSPSDQFIVTNTAVSFDGTLYTRAPLPRTLTGSVSSDVNSSVIITIDAENSRLISDARVSISGRNGTLTLYPVDPDDLGLGQFSETITVSACFDFACNRPLRGSPITLTVSYNVVEPRDSDGDGVNDVLDIFPSDPNETVDTDSDGIGNNTDLDDDNDGVLDVDDEMPLDANETLDADRDRIGNNADPDDDNDGVPDTEDAFPFNQDESIDRDRDGIGDNADTDDDNDGVEDELDDLPINPQISRTTTFISFSVSGMGSIYLNDFPIACESNCEHRQSNIPSSNTFLRVEPAEHYSMQSWQETNLNCISVTENVCEINTRHLASLSVDLNFIEDPFITIQSSSTSQGSIIEHLGQFECAGECETKIYTNTPLDFEFISIPTPGFSHLSWGEDCDGSIENCLVTASPGENIEITTSYVDAALDFDLCPGESTTEFTGSGSDELLTELGVFLLLCNGHAFLTDRLENKILYHDIVNGITLQEYQLDWAPDEIILDEENFLVFVSHADMYSRRSSSDRHISRIDLRTGEVKVIYVGGSVQSMTVSNFGDLFVQRYDEVFQTFDSRSAVVTAEPTLVGGSLTFNDATQRLTTSHRNYSFNALDKSLTELGVSYAGREPFTLFRKVAISPNGELAASTTYYSDEPGLGSQVRNFDPYNPEVTFGFWGNFSIRPTHLEFSTSNHYVSFATTFDYWLFSVDTYEEIEIIGLSPPPAPICSFRRTRDISFSSDGKLFATVSYCEDSSIVNWYAFDSSTPPE